MADNDNTDNLSASERAKKKLADIKKAKESIKSDETPKGESEIDINALDSELNNSHKPFTPEPVTPEVTPELNANGETEWVDKSEIVEETDPSKIIPPVKRPSAEKPEERGYAKVNNEPINPAEPEKIIPPPPITTANINVDPPPVTSEEPITPQPQPEPVKRQPINSSFGMMSPSEQRKNAEKTAEVILTNYAELLPILPKLLVKWDMDKMQLLDIKKEIRLSMMVTDEGLTIRDWMNNVNKQADEVFVVTDEMKESIRQPLIDVLMERGMAMTPMQRLLSAVGSQVFMFGVASAKMFMQNRTAISTFKAFKAKENNEGGGYSDDHSNDNNNNPPPPTNPVNPSPQNNQNKTQDKSEPEVSEAVVIKFDDVIHSETSAVVIEEEEDKK